jgi:hypothetical protein
MGLKGYMLWVMGQLDSTAEPHRDSRANRLLPHGLFHAPCDGFRHLHVIGLRFPCAFHFGFVQQRMFEGVLERFQRAPIVALQVVYLKGKL